jgi:cytochrome c oxidase assembly protein Cox11
MLRYYGLSMVMAMGALSYAAVPFYKMVRLESPTL